MSRKITVLSVSAGAGHVRAAQALCGWADELRLGCEITHIDVMTLVPKLFKTVYADSYIKMVEAMPALWGYLYDQTDQAKADSLSAKIRRAVERLNTKKLLAELNALDPDAVICTHFLPAELLARDTEAGRFSKPVFVVVTDFDLHRFWVQPHIAGYFAASPEVAFRMQRRGIPPERIHVTGIPIGPQFAKSLSRKICAQELSLNPDRPTFLLMSGGVGLGGMEEVAADLLAAEKGFQLIALAGRNKKLLTSLNSLTSRFPRRLLPMPFTQTIERLMACSDLAITKPGGLTTSECLAVGLPILAVSPIPGQEERNCDYLLETGAGLKAVDSGGVIYRVRELLHDPKRLERMRSAARRLGQPKAAVEILKTVLDSK